MYDLDHMLDGVGSRRHHLDIIRQVQQDKFVRDVRVAQGNRRVISPVRTFLTALVNMLTK